MKLFDIVFPEAMSAGCAVVATAAFWAATVIEEPFICCVAVFSSAFLGTLAGAIAWDAILRWSAPRRRGYSVILPGGERC